MFFFVLSAFLVVDEVTGSFDLLAILSATCVRFFELTEICGLQQYQCLYFPVPAFHMGTCITEWTQNLSATLGGRYSFMEKFGRWISTRLSDWPKVVQQ